MLNIEKYKDKLVELCVIDIDRLALIQGQPRICNSSLLCDECLFNNKNSDFCSGEALNWLFSEYKEPEVDWSKVKVDWSKVKVDTPILVRESEQNPWLKRHFAKFKGGKVYAWNSGKTFWSIEDKIGMLCWKYAKLAESEEQI